jgi:molybdopterin-guanine dinucleotide biosynthesis protein A
VKRVPVYILAGGASSRFGLDKARQPVGGRPLILHQAEVLEPVASSLSVVASRPDQYADLGLRTLADEVPGQGPVGGLATALADLQATAAGRWLLLAPCDVLGLQRRWVERLLLAAGSASPGDDGRVVAFRDRRWQPLPALYHRDLLPIARDRVRRGRLALWRLMERVPHVALPLPDDWEQAVRVNRPEDLQGISGDG